MPNAKLPKQIYRNILQEYMKYKMMHVPTVDRIERIFVQICVISESVTRHRGAIQLMPSEICEVFFFLFVKSESGRKSWLSKLSKGDEKGDSDRCSDEFSHTGGFISSPLANSGRRT